MIASTKKTSQWRQLLSRPIVWIGAAAVLGLALLSLRGALQQPQTENAYYTIKRADFLVTIVEGGTLEAVNEVVIRNLVEGNSRVIYIVPEGTWVKKGDLLVELDSGEAQEKVNLQEINYEKAKAAYVQAEQNLEIQKSVTDSAIDTAALKVKFAEIDLEKFNMGQRVQELRNAEIEITTAKSGLLLAQDTLEWSKKLFEQGFETKNAVDQGANQVQDLTLKLEKAQTNLWVLQTFDHPKNFQKFESDLLEAKKELERVKSQGQSKLEQLQADLITQKNSLELIKNKLETDRLQLVNSKVYAPQDGIAVYALNRSRFSSESMIEEGAMVRNRQELIKLPDTSQMKVMVKVHESHVNKVHPGQQAFVVLDPFPDQRLKAVVTKVALMPNAQERFGNPNLKVYDTEIQIREQIPNMKQGVSARGEIIITNIPNALTVPIQAVTTRNGKTVVFLKKGQENEPVPVEVGMFNTKFIEIVSGLNEGDEVLLSPPYSVSEKDLGGAIIGPEETLPKEDLKPSVIAPPAEPGPSSFRNQEGPGNREFRPRDGSGPGGRFSEGDPNQPGRRPRGDRTGGGPNREEMMKQFDKNGDGQLDDTERAAMREEMQKRFGNGSRPNRPPESGLPNNPGSSTP